VKKGSMFLRRMLTASATRFTPASKLYNCGSEGIWASERRRGGPPAGYNRSFITK